MIRKKLNNQKNKDQIWKVKKNINGGLNWKKILIPLII
jgi:hypothetical protein